MGAPLKVRTKRGVLAVLASGVVISLTALTGGLAPAFAQPDTDSTTTIVPEPEVVAPEPEEVVPEEPAEVPAPAAPPSQAVTAPEPPSAPAPQTQAPQTQAPEPPAVVEAEPETQAPEPKTQAPAPPKTVVTTTKPVAPASEPETAEQKPATSTAPSTASEEPGPTSAPAPASDLPSTAGSTPPSAALVPNSEASEAPTSPSTSGTKTSESNTAETATEATGGESETPTVSISQAAKEIEPAEPQTLEAPAEDVQLAKSAKPVVLDEQPAPATREDVASFSHEIETSLKLPGLEYKASSKTEIELVSNVRQWRPDWIEYDEFYRPIVLNPFRAPVRIVYIYDFRPRIVFIPPLARIVLEAAQFAAYSFTAAVLNPINAAVDTVQALTNIAVGSFFGGGFVPGIGQPFPAPPPLLRYDNVPVLVNYSNARYEPFRVRRIVDVGDDRQYGGRKVLLDGVTPAWGEWTQTATGERQFEVHKTQQFPGLDDPQEGPLPGEYPLRLASDESPTGGFTGRDIFLFVAAGVIGTLGVGAIGLVFYLGRRRPQV